MRKSKKNTKQKSNKIFKKQLNFYINTIIIILIISSMIYFIFTLYSHEVKNETTINNTKLNKKNINLAYKNEQENLEIQYIKSNNIIIKEEKKKEQVFIFNENENIKTEKNISTNIVKIKDNTIEKESEVIKDNRPKLAILIDDVSASYQVTKANALPFKVTLSFLPPTTTHNNSAIIAQNLEVAMIHLPLEASTKKFEEQNTLHIEDSLETIDKRIKYIKSIYPKVKYINNHTGSKFTSNEEAMDKLVKVLKKYNYYFVDSRTTSKTKIKKPALKYKLPYLSRDIFLDNNKDIDYIQNQLRKAVRVAKKTGSAIAICHPYPITYKALTLSSDILKDVQLVYINELKINIPK